MEAVELGGELLSSTKSGTFQLMGPAAPEVSAPFTVPTEELFRSTQEVWGLKLEDTCSTFPPFLRPETSHVASLIARGSEKDI